MYTFQLDFTLTIFFIIILKKLWKKKSILQYKNYFAF